MTDRERFEVAMLKAENGYTLNGRFECVEMWDADTLYGVWQESRRQALEEAQAACLATSDLHIRLAKKDTSHLLTALGAEQSLSRIEDLANPEGEQG